MGFNGFQEEDDIEGQIESGVRDAPTPEVAPAQTTPEAPTSAPKPEGDTSQPTATQGALTGEARHHSCG